MCVGETGQAQAASRGGRARLPGLPEPGLECPGVTLTNPPARWRRMPLSAEPAKVTSALINLINKTVRQRGHYLLIRDDRAGGSCLEHSDSATSCSPSGPKRLTQSHGRDGGQELSPTSHTRLGEGTLPQNEPLPTAGSLGRTPSQASPSPAPAGPTASWPNRQRLTGPGPRSGPGTACSFSVVRDALRRPREQCRTLWGTDLRESAGALRWHREWAPPQTPQHVWRRVGSAPAPCVPGARPAGRWGAASTRACRAEGFPGSRGCPAWEWLVGVPARPSGKLVSSRAPVPKAEAPASVLPAACALCSPRSWLAPSQPPPVRAALYVWASAPHFLDQQHPRVSLCHRRAVPMGKDCTSSSTNSEKVH